MGILSTGKNRINADRRAGTVRLAILGTEIPGFIPLFGQTDYSGRQGLLIDIGYLAGAPAAD
jgi:hypothetical protein